MQDQLKELEELSNILRVTKEYLKRKKGKDKEVEAQRKSLGLPKDYPFYGIDIKDLRTWAREIHNLYKTYDFAKFFKLLDIFLLATVKCPVCIQSFT